MNQQPSLMWDVVERNQRRSWMLIGAMGALLLVLGFFTGSAIYAHLGLFQTVADDVRHYGDSMTRLHDVGELPDFKFQLLQFLKSPELWFNGGGLIGLGIAAILWGILTLYAFVAGDDALLRMASAHPLSKDQAPRVYNLVEEMTIASGLGKMPAVYLVADDQPNAFAVGLNENSAAVAVTTGMVRQMNRDELQGVIAHEIAHIRNLDVRFMTLASILLGSITLISETFLRSMWYSSGRRSSSSNKGGGGAVVVVLIIVAMLLAVLAPIAARLLYFACSRRREYLADACAATYTRYPAGLASALMKVQMSGIDGRRISRSLAPLYLVNPRQSASFSSVFSTHPPLEHRISILRDMAGAGFVDYENAFRAVVGGGRRCIDEGILQNQPPIKKRDPSPKETEQDNLGLAREALDIVDRAANYLIFGCACGVRLKMPPEMKRDEIKCPRCGRINEVPHAIAISAIGAMRSELEGAVHAMEAGGKGRGRSQERERPSQQEQAGISYQRRSTGWESFRCPCDATIQLSPSFGARFASCRNCGRHIRVIPSDASDNADD